MLAYEVATHQNSFVTKRTTFRTSDSLGGSCNACANVRFVAFADSGDTTDAEGWDFAFSRFIGSSMMRVVTSLMRLWAK